jgi:nicotinate (nicotinamide) nucleotide adenylyltransferase
MDTKKLQKQTADTFKENFGYTPFSERLKDITNEFFELMKWNDIKNIKEETGDLMASLIMLAEESGWNFEDLVKDTLIKINRRREQYKTLGRKIKVALYGGAFDMIHDGHIQTAKFVLDTSNEFDEVWILPCFHHMYNKSMAPAEHRLEMARIAAEVDKRIKVFDYEIRNKFFGETFYFVKRLKEETNLTEMYNFSMIIGQDNANTFDTWVNYQELERMMRFVIIPRKGVERMGNIDWYLKPPHIFLNKEKTGIIEASSTELRKMMKSYWKTPTEKKKNQLLEKLDVNVFDYILRNNLYH